MQHHTFVPEIAKWTWSTVIPNTELMRSRTISHQMESVQTLIDLYCLKR